MVADGGTPGTPGHAAPVGVELSALESVTAWLAEMGYENAVVADGSDKYDVVLLAEGYDSLFTLNFTETDLVDLGVLKPHARRMVTAAAAVSRTLGTAAAVAGGGGGRRLAAAFGDGSGKESDSRLRGKLEAIPSGEGNKGCGIAGLPSRGSMTLWVATLVGWTRASWPEYAEAVRSLRLHPAQDVDLLKAKVNWWAE